MLEDGESPEPRTAALIGLLSASGSLSSLRPPLPWSWASASRARKLERGAWGHQGHEVSVAVVRTAAGIAAASAAAAIKASTDTR